MPIGPLNGKSGKSSFFYQLLVTVLPIRVGPCLDAYLFRAMNLENNRVLVTGADGFIGSNLVEHLLRAGAQVTALAQYNSFNFWGWLEDIPRLNQIQVVTGDIRDGHFCLS